MSNSRRYLGIGTMKYSAAVYCWISILRVGVGGGILRTVEF